MTRPWPARLLVAGCALAVYLTGLTAPFTLWDDPYYVTRSAHAHAPGLAGFLGSFDAEQVAAHHLVEFFPLRDALYWLWWHAFGAQPLPYHALNMALHALAAVLVRRLALQLGASAWAALGAGVLFATHPVHVESVTWISALKDPLALVFVLLSVSAYLRYRERQGPKDYALFFLALVAGLASKSLALPVVLVLACAERLVGAPTPWPEVFRRLMGPAVVTGAALFQMVAVGRAAGTVTDLHGGSLGSHVFLMLWAQVRYLQQAVAPASFRLHYCFPPWEGLADPRGWAIAAAVPLVIAGAALAWRKSRLATLLVAWHFAFLLPVSNLVPFPALMADRYLYASSVAAAIGAALLFERVRARTALLTAAALVFGAITSSRGLVWRSERELWDEVAADAACWKEPTALAANALLQWAVLQPTPLASAEALERALAHPGFGLLAPSRGCDRFRLSPLKAPQADLAAEARAAALQVRSCPRAPEPWERLARVELRRDPEAAARAARELYQRDRRPFRLWQRGSARLLAGDAGGAEDVEAAARRAPEVVCPAFRQWRPRASPAAQEQTRATAAQCGSG